MTDWDRLYPVRVACEVPPNATVSLADFFGPVQPCLRLQYTYPGECFFGIAPPSLLVADGVDAHRRATAAVAAGYLALGIDSNRARLYRQSDVPELFELAWLIDSLTPRGSERSNPNDDYRVMIQVAHLVGLRATVVPELPRHEAAVALASRFAKELNQVAGTEVVPEPRVLSESWGVGEGRNTTPEPGLDSVPIFGPEASIVESIRNLSVDAARQVEELIKAPSLRPAPNDDPTPSGVISASADPTLEVDRSELSQAVLRVFSGSAAQYRRLAAAPNLVEVKLQAGAAAARAEIRQTLQEVQNLMGFGPLRTKDFVGS